MSHEHEARATANNQDQEPQTRHEASPPTCHLPLARAA
eukprot:CAMPEP_0118985644 /NCGR_PEP_ID=MMETSP1173-20130426/40469_1 /TAXON_ID=1034831 /ORGANISM="Rhizochromulina marina cf, Strain CCMP1243" /LENGTH=37 /DNA_ID= /DNA_START= /DNA_END= /DNA_ORIENTATION=